MYKVGVINQLVTKAMMSTVKPTAAIPQSRDADRSQQAILMAARDEFAQYGLGGARIDRIAARAQLNKRLIYYYFTSKDELFAAVLARMYTDIRTAEQQLRLTELEPIQAIKKLMEFTWEYYLEHPEFITLLNSENLHQARHLSESTQVREMNSPLIQTLGEILERGRNQGVFRGGIDPVQLYISMAGMAYFYLSNNHTLSVIFGRDLMTPKARNARLSHMTDVMLGYALKD
jgi:AcrR family transcriptional regulator